MSSSLIPVHLVCSFRVKEAAAGLILIFCKYMHIYIGFFRAATGYGNGFLWLLNLIQTRLSISVSGNIYLICR